MAHNRWAHCAVVVCLNAPYAFGHRMQLCSIPPDSGQQCFKPGLRPSGEHLRPACQVQQCTSGRATAPRGCKARRSSLPIRTDVSLGSGSGAILGACANELAYPGGRRGCSHRRTRSRWSSRTRRRRRWRTCSPQSRPGCASSEFASPEGGNRVRGGQHALTRLHHSRLRVERTRLNHSFSTLSKMISNTSSDTGLSPARWRSWLIISSQIWSETAGRPSQRASLGRGRWGPASRVWLTLLVHVVLNLVG